MGSKRILWIDYLKAISMLLVVVYHTPERYNVLDEGVVFNLGVPIFFVLAGFLYNPAKHAGTGQYLLHRARQLLIPYATFFVVFYALWLAVGRRMVGPEEEAIAWWTPLYEFATGQPTVVLGAFWYIACLFSMQVVYHVLQRWIPGKWMIAASVVLALSTYVLYIHPWNVGKAFIYMPLYAVGHTCREALAAIARQPARLRLATAVPLVAGIAVLAAVALPVGVHVTVRLKIGERLIEAGGVVKNRSKLGLRYRMGIQFTEIAPEQQELLLLLYGPGGSMEEVDGL